MTDRAGGKPKKPKKPKKPGITPEMIEAGALEVYASEQDDTSEERAISIYEAMEAARLRSASGRPPPRRRKP